MESQGRRALDETMRGGIADRAAIEVKVEVMGLNEGGEKGHKHNVTHRENRTR